MTKTWVRERKNMGFNNKHFGSYLNAEAII
jgi:hypothetical protein